jgi:hypothetical protein
VRTACFRVLEYLEFGLLTQEEIYILCVYWLQEAEMIEERRILLAKRYGLMENTFDYPPSGPNHSHDPKVPHPYGNEKTNN